MIRRVALVAAIALVVAYAPQPAAATPPEWSIIDLGTLGGETSSAYAVNKHAQVVGESTTAAGLTHAFLWQDGVMTDLGTLGGSYSRARDINDRAQVVGESTTAAGLTHAFLWQDGVITDLGALPNPDHPLSSSAYAINNRGQIVGGSGLTGGHAAVIWQDGVIADLGCGPEDEATAINDRGQIVCQRMYPQRRAFLLEGGVKTDLGALGAGAFAETSAYAINARAQIVGCTNADIGEPNRAFLWQSGVMTDLGALGGNASMAYGINDRGQIVGSSGGHAFLWEDGAMSDLGTLGGTTAGATDINDRGEIVGTRQLQTGTRAFLWTR